MCMATTRCCRGRRDGSVHVGPRLAFSLVVDSQLAVVAEVHPPSAPALISADASAP